MKSGSSAPISSGSQVVAAASSNGSTQWSRPSVMLTSAPVWRTTSTVSQTSAPTSASSLICLSATCLPPRNPSSEVTSRLHSASRMRLRNDSDEKPANTTLWTAPMRAQASIAAGSEGIIGRYKQTRSPRLTP